MVQDYVFEQLKARVSSETKINQIEVDKALDCTFRGLKELLGQGVKRVKIPHLGTFREKKNFKNDYGDTRLSDTGE